MKDIFNQTDFFDLVDNRSIPQQCAEISNNKLRKLIEEAPVVYGNQSLNDTFYWLVKPLGSLSKYDTHRAKLMFIEEIKKKPCKHEPPVTNDTGRFGRVVNIDYATCVHCGCELESIWQEKE